MGWKMTKRNAPMDKGNQKWSEIEGKWERKRTWADWRSDESAGLQLKFVVLLNFVSLLSIGVFTIFHIYQATFIVFARTAAHGNVTLFCLYALFLCVFFFYSIFNNTSFSVKQIVMLRNMPICFLRKWRKQKGI